MGSSARRSFAAAQFWRRTRLYVLRRKRRCFQEQLPGKPWLLIADIEAPRHGVIRAKPQNLFNLAESLRAHESEGGQWLLSQ
jgi:hypothetical protein